MDQTRHNQIDVYENTCHKEGLEHGVLARIADAYLGTSVLGAQQAAALLGLSARTLRAHVRAGNIACVRLGFGERRPRRGFLSGDLIAFMARLRRIECRRDGTYRSASVDGVSAVPFTQRNAAGRGTNRGRSRPRSGGPSPGTLVGSDTSSRDHRRNK